MQRRRFRKDLLNSKAFHGGYKVYNSYFGKSAPDTSTRVCAEDGQWHEIAGAASLTFPTLDFDTADHNALEFNIRAELGKLAVADFGTIPIYFAEGSIVATVYTGGKSDKNKIAAGAAAIVKAVLARTSAPAVGTAAVGGADTTVCFGKPAQGFMVGNVLRQLKRVPSTRECAAACTLSAECAAFHFSANAKICGLKSASGTAHTKKSFQKTYRAYTKILPVPATGVCAPVSAATTPPPTPAVLTTPPPAAAACAVACADPTPRTDATVCASTFAATDSNVQCAVKLWCSEDGVLPTQLSYYSYYDNEPEITCDDAEYDYAAGIPPSCWETSAVKTMKKLFYDMSAKNGYTCGPNNLDIDSWRTCGVTDMESMFTGFTEFNSPLDSWQTGSVTSMYGMFQQLERFNQPMNSWQTGCVQNFRGMFLLAKTFNQPLPSWRILGGENRSAHVGAEMYTKGKFLGSAVAATACGMFDGTPGCPTQGPGARPELPFLPEISAQCALGKGPEWNRFWNGQAYVGNGCVTDVQCEPGYVLRQWDSSQKTGTCRDCSYVPAFDAAAVSLGCVGQVIPEPGAVVPSGSV